MSRSLQSRSKFYVLTQDSKSISSRTALSSKSISKTSLSHSSTPMKAVLESSIISLASGPLLGVRKFNDSSQQDIRGSQVTYSSIGSRLSPKPVIRKYGRTTHSQGFSSPSLEKKSTSTKTSSDSSSPQWHHWRLQIPGRLMSSPVHVDKIAKENDNNNVTSFQIRQKDELMKIGSRDKVSELIGRRLRHVNESENKTSEQRLMSTEEHASQSDFSDSHAPAHSPTILVAQFTRNSYDTLEERSRSPHRACQKFLNERREGSAGEVFSKEWGERESTEAYSRVTDFHGSVKLSEGGLWENLENSSEELHVESTTVSAKSNISQSHGWNSRHIKIKKPPSDMKLEQDHPGVHLDEPTSPAAERWSGHVTSPVRSQWTDEELDAFVRQLSNPQHQVAKSGPRDQTSSPTLRKCSLDLCHELKDRERIRAPLARSETDSSVSFGELESPLLERGGVSLSGEDVSRDGSLITGISGLRLIKNKKMVRSSHANAKRYIAQKSRDEHKTASTASLQDLDDEGMSEAAAPIRELTGNTVTFSNNSSPDGSDGEVGGERRLSGHASNGTSKTLGKKRRFRKMLSRPLNRSQSAGCAKDVPAHALFLEQQQKKSKETETMAARKARASEGDIRHARRGDNNDFEGDSTSTNASSSSKKNNVGRIHKTKSADSAMMATDEFGAISQPKSKSRNIAKKITRKMQFLRRRHTDSTLGLMGKDDGARRLASVVPEEAQQWGRSFESLLFDKTGLELFRGFLLSEHSDENIEFWIACENYKTVRSTKQLPSMAMKIFSDYVAVQSKREINLDSKTRNLTYESVTSNPTRQTFDEAQRRVQALMEKDSYRRFLESEVYQDLAAGNIQHKS